MNASRPFLDPQRDPPPVEVINGDSVEPILLVCEHAGRAVPNGLDDLGLSREQMELHIAHDIGAECVARRLAQRFGCALVIQPYSRLVIDCNRPPGTRESILEQSDGVPIPGNMGLGPDEKARRVDEIFGPYAARCATMIARDHLRGAFSIHSFTPRMQGRERPWDIGFLYRDPIGGGEEMATLCARRWPELVVGRNEPYRIEDETDWFIPVCAEPRGVPHCLVEIRNDHLRTAEGRAMWADRLFRLISEFMERSDAPVS